MIKHRHQYRFQRSVNVEKDKMLLEPLTDDDELLQMCLGYYTSLENANS